MKKEILLELQERANVQGELFVPDVGVFVPEVETPAEPEKKYEKYEKKITEEVKK